MNGENSANTAEEKDQLKSCITESGLFLSEYMLKRDHDRIIREHSRSVASYYSTHPISQLKPTEELEMEPKVKIWSQHRHWY